MFWTWRCTDSQVEISTHVLLIYSMEQSPPWEANWSAASQEIPRILWKPKVHYHIHKGLPPFPNQFMPQSHLLKIHLNIILPSMPGSSKWALSHRFPHQKPVYASPPHTCYLPAHLIPLDLIKQTIFGEQYKSLISSLCSFLHSLVASSPLGPNILLNTLFLNTLGLRSSLNMNDQVSNPYTTTGQIIFLYILIFKFVDRKLEDEGFYTEW